jgi:hypothetical protein
MTTESKSKSSYVQFAIPQFTGIVSVETKLEAQNRKHLWRSLKVFSASPFSKVSQKSIVNETLRTRVIKTRCCLNELVTFTITLFADPFRVGENI